MRTILIAAAALAFAGAAQAETVVVAPGGGPATSETTTVAPGVSGTVVEERGTVVEETNPYAPRLERNTQARERTPNVGDGTSSSRNANQN